MARLDAVTIIALHGDGAAPEAPRRLVVIEEFRVPVDGWEFGLPAGLMDAGETAETCATRASRQVALSSISPERRLPSIRSLICTTP